MKKLFYACVVAFGLATVVLAVTAHAEPGKAEVSVISATVASVRACGGAPEVRLLAERAIFDQCREASIRRAIVEVGSPLLDVAR